MFEFGTFSSRPQQQIKPLPEHVLSFLAYVVVYAILISYKAGLGEV